MQRCRSSHRGLPPPIKRQLELHMQSLRRFVRRSKRPSATQNPHAAVVEGRSTACHTDACRSWRGALGQTGHRCNAAPRHENSEVLRSMAHL